MYIQLGTVQTKFKDMKDEPCNEQSYTWTNVIFQDAKIAL